MPQHLVSTIISAAAVIIGAVIGGVWSYYVSKKTTLRHEQIQNKILKENRKIDESYNKIKLKESVAIVRLDICTAIFQSIRTLKYIELEKKKYYPNYITVNKNYSRDIAILTHKFSLKEISAINRIYGIIEKINFDVKQINYNNQSDFKNILINYKILLNKIYGEHFLEVIKLNVNELNYEQLIDNKLIKAEYKTVLLKLEKILKDINNNY